MCACIIISIINSLYLSMMHVISDISDAFTRLNFEDLIPQIFYSLQIKGFIWYGSYHMDLSPHFKLSITMMTFSELYWRFNVLNMTTTLGSFDELIVKWVLILRNENNINRLFFFRFRLRIHPLFNKDTTLKIEFFCSKTSPALKVKV